MKLIKRCFICNHLLWKYIQKIINFNNWGKEKTFTSCHRNCAYEMCFAVDDGSWTNEI